MQDPSLAQERLCCSRSAGPDRLGVELPECDVPVLPLDIACSPAAQICARDLPLPELSEPEVIRHFTHLSQKNYSVDSRLLSRSGSCTMKYNPKINEESGPASRGSRDVHPYLPDSSGAGRRSKFSSRCRTYITEIGGHGHHVSLQPAAGAHGELLGLMLIKRLP